MYKESNKALMGHDAFHDIFTRTLKHRSNSRPPKLELTGVLIPIPGDRSRSRCGFKLEADHDEFLLQMDETVASLAKKLKWEEVTVRGYVDREAGLVEVEKIFRTCRDEPDRAWLPPTDFYYELERYRRSIETSGRLGLECG